MSDDLRRAYLMGDAHSLYEKMPLFISPRMTVKVVGSTTCLILSAAKIHAYYPSIPCGHVRIKMKYLEYQIFRIQESQIVEV